MQKKTERTAQFNVFDDSGKLYAVTEYTEYLKSPTVEDSEEWERGLRSFKLANGGHLNLLDDGSYKIVQTGVIVRRRD